MLRSLLGGCGGAALAAILLVGMARAEALSLTAGRPAVRTISVGRPRRPVRVELATGPALVLKVGGERHRLPAQAVREVTLSEIVVGDDAAVALLSGEGDGRGFVALLGGRDGGDLLLFDSLEPRGDPGETRRRELAVDGRALRTGLHFEGSSLCGGRPAWHDVRRLDPETLRLVPDTAHPPHTELVEADVDIVTGPGPTPKVDALTPVSSSELDPNTRLPLRPHALLTDAGHEVSAGSFAQLRWDVRDLPIARLELEVVSPRPEVVELWWLGNAPEAVRAVLPSSGGTTTYRVTPPHPLTGPCIALYVAKPAGEVRGLALRGLRAYTALDETEGVRTLIGALVQDGERAGRAADLLARLGPEVAEELAARWQELSPRGRRRAVSVLAEALDRPLVRERVLESAALAAEDEAEVSLRAAAIEALARGGTRGVAALAELAAQPGEAGDLAASRLGVECRALDALLSALAQPGGEDRSGLREALSACARRDSTRFIAASRAWLARPASAAARAALALSAADAGEHALAAEIAERHAPEAGRFEDRYRFALALKDAPLGRGAAAWLAREAREAPEWMQRRAAFDALTRSPERLPADLPIALLGDPYPRVRESALDAAVAGGSWQRAAELAAADPWPRVRAAGLRALARVPESRAVLEAGLDDRAPGVRRAAIEALRARADRTAWPRIASLLTSDDEAFGVRAAAIAFASELCVREAAAPLAQVAGVVVEAHDPAASHEPRRRLAVEALRALAALGGAARADGDELVRRAGEPALTALWSRLRPRCDGSSGG